MIIINRFQISLTFLVFLGARVVGELEDGDEKDIEGEGGGGEGSSTSSQSSPEYN